MDIYLTITRARFSKYTRDAIRSREKNSYIPGWKNSAPLNAALLLEDFGERREDQVTRSGPIGAAAWKPHGHVTDNAECCRTFLVESDPSSCCIRVLHLAS